MKERYKKPYIEEIGTPREAWFHCAGAEKEPVFPYLVMDGGAFLFMNDRLGIQNGDQLLEKVMDGSFFTLWQKDGHFDWDVVFGLPAQDTMRNFEWHIFLQRLYILLPLATAYKRTGERRYAQKYIELFKDWMQKHPYEAFDASISYFATGFYWRDMQVAWRTIVLAFSLFFLDGAFEKEDWLYLYAALQLHADHLYQEAEAHIQKGDAQNHVLQVGTALLYAGCLFGEFPNAQQYIEFGKNIVKQNLDKAIFADGGSDEDSPSYSHFIARLYLDAHVLLENNGYESIPGLKESIAAQYELLYQFSTKDNKTLQINDSYTMDVGHDLEIVQEIMPMDFIKRKESRLFPESCLAVLRNENYEIFIDAMPLWAWHQHAGRPNIVVYYKNRPILVDSGACNYDDRNLRDEYLISAKAHNAVSCEELGVHSCANVKDGYRITRFETGDPQRVEIEGTFACGEVCFALKRTVVLYRDCFTVEDEAWAEKEYHFYNVMHLAPGRFTQTENGLIQQHGERLLYVKCGPEKEVQLLPCITQQNCLGVSPAVFIKNRGNRIKTFFEFQMQ